MFIVPRDSNLICVLHKSDQRTAPNPRTECQAFARVYTHNSFCRVGDHQSPGTNCMNAAFACPAPNSIFFFFSLAKIEGCPVAWCRQLRHAKDGSEVLLRILSHILAAQLTLCYSGFPSFRLTGRHGKRHVLKFS